MRPKQQMKDSRNEQNDFTLCYWEFKIFKRIFWFGQNATTIQGNLINLSRDFGASLAAGRSDTLYSELRVFVAVANPQLHQWVVLACSETSSKLTLPPWPRSAERNCEFAVRFDSAFHGRKTCCEDEYRNDSWSTHAKNNLREIGTQSKFPQSYALFMTTIGWLF